MSNLTRLYYFENNISWSLESFLQWSLFYANDFDGNKDKEHRIYKTHLEAIYNDPNLLKNRDSESLQKSAEALKNFKMEADSVQVGEFWKKSPSFLETLKIAINLNADKMVSRVAELHDDFSNTIFSVTQNQLQLRFGHKRSYSHEENFLEPQRKKILPGRGVGNVLPDGTKFEKATPLDLVQSDDDEHLSQGDNDEDEDIPALKDRQNVGKIIEENVSANAEKVKNKKRLTIYEKAILRYGVSNIIDLSVMNEWFSAKDIKFMAKDYIDLLKVPQLPAEENTFISKVESMTLKGDANGAYKFCIETHVNSEENNYMYKISKIYSELSKNKVDILDYAGDTHTELDVIMKAFGYIIEGLNNGFGTHQKWGESFCPLSKSKDYNKGRKCDLRFLSISGVDLGEWEFASEVIPHKVVSDRCRSARVNQSILNGLLNLNLTDEQAKNIKVPFVQICGTSGQMLIVDLVEDFYVVFPGPKFELPTKLQHIKKLKSAVNIINFIMNIYEQTNEIAETQENTRNGFNDIFSDNAYIKPIHYKAKYIHKPWWSPKSKRS
ncbi:10694_t:CDS:2 [Dentiscutata heterogama]|uniref:10694_t:CDS:1 n=1 Tax=Dentiscutata heterogama TaxID=1316150 RepID=A0ACA9L7Y4_9GLOM|nr:10694_t:CDS:2 [Dentiscutata heterogama]